MKADDLPIWYEPHPVTQERKREITSQGFRIIDAVFDPARIEQPKADPVAVDEMQRADLIAALQERGLPTTGRLAGMRERLKGAQ